VTFSRVRRIFKSGSPTFSIEITQILNSTTHVGRLGATAAYAILDYCDSFCISSAYIQLPVPENATVYAASLVTPDKYTNCLSREK